MTRKVFFRADALEDSEVARTWYECQRAGLGERFAHAVTHSAERIGLWPFSRAIVFKDIRAFKLIGFPYVVYYRVKPDYVEVLAVLHGRRDETAWKSRS